MSIQHNPAASAARTDPAKGPLEGAAWMDKRPRRGRLRFEGRDVVAFLNALVSNDVGRLRAGEGTYATYLTPQGRLVADLRIYHRGASLLVDVPADQAERLAARFDQLVFSEDVRVADASRELTQLTVVGPAAPFVIALVSGVPQERLESLPVWSQESAGPLVIARTDDVSVPSFDLFAPATTHDEVVAALMAAGATPMSDRMFDALRIEAGRPEFGIEMTEETIPLEAGLLDRAISTTKGCYVGQEIIIRVLHRGGGRVAKRLVKLVLEPGAPQAAKAGASVIVDGAEVGYLTSTARSPMRDRVIALAYVARDAAQVGHEVVVRFADSEASATIEAMAG